ncbi:MAG TPA: carbonic anhydrase family protein [Bdellovibrionota bacterium]|jgi:carbonic anhydrase|nr:carbonic anhydrase family protein [Bdellovibrionota bacterium]
MKISHLASLIAFTFVLGCSSSKPDATAKIVIKGKNDLPTAEIGDPGKAAAATEEAATEGDVAAESEMKAMAWNYADAGPAKWAALNESFVLCGKGLEQSPVNLKWTKPMVGRKLAFFYEPGVFQIEAHSQKLQVTFAKGNHTMIDGQRWNLVAMQLHTLAEHSFSKKTFPLEVQLVHYDEAQTKLGIIAVVFREGKANPGLETLLKHLPKAVPGREFVENEPINPSLFLPLVTTHYAYQGSITYPPCTEGVSWTVLNTPVEASKEQIAVLKKLAGRGNARPAQPLNHRKPVNYN